MEPLERRKLILERVRTGLAVTADEIVHLRDTADRAELRLVDCAGEPIEQSISSRLALLKPVEDRLAVLGVAVGSSALWNHYLPLARVISAWTSADGTCIGGVVGLPGAGKTTLTTSVKSAVTLMMEKPVAVVSLDDFYFTPAERQSLGFRWRAMPGTHDLRLLTRFLDNARNTDQIITIPRYDTRTETRLPNVVLPRPRLILFEGWFVGAWVPGYEVLAEALDFLIYIDMELGAAHRSRLLREEKIRSESNSALGMSAEETECFWQEAILPTAMQWVLPLRSKADLTLRVDERHHIREISNCSNKH